MGAVLFDDGVDELLSGGSPAEQADAPLKLRHEGHWVTDQVSPLNGCVPHLPTGKLPGQETQARLLSTLPRPQTKSAQPPPQASLLQGENDSVFRICQVILRPGALNPPQPTNIY